MAVAIRRMFEFRAVMMKLLIIGVISSMIMGASEFCQSPNLATPTSSAHPLARAQ
jgi:hypothetical protein